MKISASTVTRTVVLAIALVNQILTAAGLNPLPFAEETVYELLAAVFTLGAAAVAWWKNNSFTDEAIAADAYMNKLKEKRESEDI
ncbi:MAG: phage holin [Clostridia bacterium]|nr:phage holin [Clostridia bacterium]